MPCAPVRDVAEVMGDPHMHERGMLEELDHVELGRVTLPNSPLRFHGAAKVPSRPNPQVGEHNRAVYCDWLGLSGSELDRLKQAGAI